MAKSFFEVFPQVKLNREIAGMLDETVISRVSTPPAGRIFCGFT